MNLLNFVFSSFVSSSLVSPIFLLISVSLGVHCSISSCQWVPGKNYPKSGNHTMIKSVGVVEAGEREMYLQQRGSQQLQ